MIVPYSYYNIMLVLLPTRMMTQGHRGVYEFGSCGMVCAEISWWDAYVEGSRSIMVCTLVRVMVSYSYMKII
jgi:hypothetical protein